MTDRVFLISELRAIAINQRAALDSTLRLIRSLESTPAPVPDHSPPQVPLVAKADPPKPFRQGRKPDEARNNQIRESIAAGLTGPQIADRLKASISQIYRIKREMDAERFKREAAAPRPATQPIVISDLAQRTATRIEAFIERHGPTAYSPLLQALDVTPREFNEALPHITTVEKIDGLWQVRPRIEKTYCNDTLPASLRAS